MRNLYCNEIERNKWRATRDFVKKYLSRDSVVLDTFAGVGFITEIYASHVKRVVAIEVDNEVFKSLKEHLVPYSNIQYYNENSEVLISRGLNDKFDVIDFDPWGCADKLIVKSLNLLKEHSYLAITNCDPFVISRFKCTIKKYGEPYINDWRGYSKRYYDQFISPVLENNGLESKLISHMDTSNICRIIVETNRLS